MIKRYQESFFFPVSLKAGKGAFRELRIRIMVHVVFTDGYGGNTNMDL